MRLFEPHILSAFRTQFRKRSRVPSPTTQERECAVLRAAHSLFLSCTTKQEGVCAVLGNAHSLYLSHTISHERAQRERM